MRVAGGEAVKKGQALLVLEAMKMEHTIAAPHDGIVAEIVAEGAQVTDGAVLGRGVIGYWWGLALGLLAVSIALSGRFWRVSSRSIAAL